MLVPRLAASACALLVLTSCFGGGGSADPSPTSTVTPHPGQRGVTGQRIVFAKGAEVAQGVLVQTCDVEGCTRVDASGPIGKLTVFEPRPILSVTFELEPDAVEGVVRRDGRRSEPTALSAGTLVAWRPLVEPGRSELRLIATYGADRVEWTINILRR